MGTRILGFFLAALWLFHCGHYLIPSEGIPIILIKKSYMALAASFSLLMFLKEGSQVLKVLIYLCERSKIWKRRSSLEQCIIVLSVFLHFFVSQNLEPLLCSIGVLVKAHRPSHWWLWSCWLCYKYGQAIGLLSGMLWQIKSSCILVDNFVASGLSRSQSHLSKLSADPLENLQ